jgi:SAM-dependent methyltransferase
VTLIIPFPSNLSGFDFLDFGSGVGGSLEYCERRFGGIGLGIDTAKNKVKIAQGQGKNVCLGDILALPGEKAVSFVSMMDFLEHLPSEAVALAMIKKACALASDFVFFAHPSFEDE